MCCGCSTGKSSTPRTENLEQRQAREMREAEERLRAEFVDEVKFRLGFHFHQPHPPQEMVLAAPEGFVPKTSNFTS